MAVFGEGRPPQRGIFGDTIRATKLVLIL